MNNAMNNPLLDIQNLEKTFTEGKDRTLTVLNNLSMSIEKGEMVALVGPSGSGKSTLLQMVGLLDTPTQGRITLEGQDVSGLNDKARTALRQDFVGFVYQFHHLQPEFSAVENIMLPQMIAGKSKKDAKTKALELLETMGLSDRTSHRPAKLSGGEKQRVAIARALANDPQLLLADEPTGNLDPHTSEKVFDLLLQRVRDTGISAFIVTHDAALAKRMDRVLELDKINMI